MKKNTIKLSIKKYNELKDFKKKIKNGDVCQIIAYTRYPVISYLNPNDAVKDIVAEYNETQKQYKILAEIHERNTLEIEKIKKMGLFEFLKWKNQK